ncbi:hypothetical protein [Deinococcus navajonensis]|uniref:Uncharacterized protein n=1 Tax=Deinococcus navajonensis TaxID=309884 RepID=A0ABV8XIJ3_9DEIO
MTQPDKKEDVQLSESARSRTGGDVTPDGRPAAENGTDQERRPPEDGTHGRPSDDADPGHS